MKEFQLFTCMSILVCISATPSFSQKTARPTPVKLPFAFSDVGRTPMENTPVFFNSHILLVSIYISGGQNISADFPGAVSRGLEKNLGEKVYTLFAQGAGGNVKPRIYNPEKKSFKTPSQEELDNFGQEYADQISKHLQSGKMKEIPLELAYAEKEFEIPFDLKRVPAEGVLRQYSEKDNSNYHNRLYIPTGKIIEEGGYKGDFSMVYSLATAPFVKEIDDIIKKEVLSLKV